MTKSTSNQFDKLCEEIEITTRVSRSTKKSRVEIKKSVANDSVILIDDDDIEEEFINLTTHKKKSEQSIKVKEIRLLTNVTNQIQNVDRLNDDDGDHQQQQMKRKKTPTKQRTPLKKLKSIENEIAICESVVDLNTSITSTISTCTTLSTLSAKQESSKEDLKTIFKNLKPVNYRIQQVIKEEDLIFFDLETGGMGSKQDILQIGAINYYGKQFNMYATPTQPINGMASRVHHITFKDNVMYYRKNPVKHHSIIEVLLRFIDYLNQSKSDNLVLVAHNANFDRRFIIEKMYEFNLQSRLNAKVIGFLDTLPLFKQLLPGMPTYKQDRLVLHHFPQTKAQFHNALNDVIYLKKLFNDKALKQMKNEFKFINQFTQTLEYGFMKKEQQLFEEMGKKKPKAKKVNNENKNSKNAAKKDQGAVKKRKAASSGIFIDGVAVPRTRSTRQSSNANKSMETRRSKRVKGQK